MNKTNNAIIIFIFSNIFNFFSQENNYSEIYPKDDVITLKLKKHLNITLKNDKLVITQQVIKDNYYITNENFNFADEHIYYNSFNVLKNIKASTNTIIKGKSKNIGVTEFKNRDVITNAFYDDQREKMFTYKNVTVNATTHLDYSLQINDPHFIPAFILKNKIPIEKVIYSVSFPKEVAINYETFNLENTKVKFKEVINNEITTYTWQFDKVKKTSTDFDFSSLYYVPQIIVRIKSYQNATKTISVLSNVDDLYNWYCDLTKNINNTEQKQLKEIAINLTKDLPTAEEKIKAIYYFIQDRINYIAFEDGLNEFIPRDAMNIYNNAYGDCKDMANILNEMLHYANIDSYLTWIGTRDRPYTYKELPTALTDNHMITAVKINDKIQFLDATAKYLPFGYPSPFIQGKQALVGISNEEYKLVNVPEMDADTNKEINTSTFFLENLTLKGTHKVILTGYKKLRFRHKYENKKDDNLDFLFYNLKYGSKRTSFTKINYAKLATKYDSLTQKQKIMQK